MENKKKKKLFCQIGNFCLELGKNILFGIGNGAKFRPQNRVIKSPESIGKNIILCVLKGEIPVKMHKIIFVSRKKICVPILPKIFRPVTRNTHILFLFGLKSAQ